MHMYIYIFNSVRLFLRVGTMVFTENSNAAASRKMTPPANTLDSVKLFPHVGNMVFRKHIR